MYWTKFTRQYIPDEIYQTKYTGQYILYQLQTNYTLDIDVRIRVIVRIRGRVRIRVRAECATEESLKHPMATYVWVYFKLTLRTSNAGIPALRKLPCCVGSRYTGGMVCQRQASDAGLPALFSNAYWHLNA